MRAAGGAHCVWQPPMQACGVASVLGAGVGGANVQTRRRQQHASHLLLLAHLRRPTTSVARRRAVTHCGQSDDSCKCVRLRVARLFAHRLAVGRRPSAPGPKPLSSGSTFSTFCATLRTAYRRRPPQVGPARSACPRSTRLRRGPARPAHMGGSAGRRPLCRRARVRRPNQ